MIRKFEDTCSVKCTNNDRIVEAELDNFREHDGMDIFIATNKIRFKWNGKVYVGNAHGMEFTTAGPKEHYYKEGRR